MSACATPRHDATLQLHAWPQFMLRMRSHRLFPLVSPIYLHGPADGKLPSVTCSGGRSNGRDTGCRKRDHLLNGPDGGNPPRHRARRRHVRPRLGETATFAPDGTRLTGDLFARHLDETGNFTTGNFLAQMTQFGHDRFFGDPLTTPLVVQQSDGSIMTEFALLGAGDTEVIGAHNVDANFTDAPLPFTVPKAANNHESLANSVATLHGTAVSFEVDDASFTTHTFLRWYNPDRTVNGNDQQLGKPGRNRVQFRCQAALDRHRFRRGRLHALRSGDQPVRHPPRVADAVQSIRAILHHAGSSRGDLIHSTASTVVIRHDVKDVGSLGADPCVSSPPSLSSRRSPLVGRLRPRPSKGRRFG